MISVLHNIANIGRIPDLRNKILFVIAMIVLYRIGSFVPVPGINFSSLRPLQDEADQGGVLAFLRLFSGGALTQFAVFSLGVIPYITASIIMQVLAVVVPRIEQWQQQGAVGQRKINQWTRYITIGIALVQSTSLAFYFTGGAGGLTDTAIPDLLAEFTPQSVTLVVLTLTAGTAVLMWMGELMTQKGIGNGISLLIFAAVVSGLPGQLSSVRAQSGWWALFVVVGIYLVLLVAIVFVEQGQRRIPVQFAKRVVGRRMTTGGSTYIPLKVNQSGVIPIIFASSVLYLPQLVVAVLPRDGWGERIQRWVDDHLFTPSDPVYLVVFGLLIIGFAYFYTAITFDPVKQADTLRRQGGFIPGIRPGPQTERYMARILSRITLPGALFLAIIALVPAIMLAQFLPDETLGVFGFTGISILIAVGVSLETMKQVDSQLMMRNYEGFLKQ